MIVRKSTKLPAEKLWREEAPQVGEPTQVLKRFTKIAKALAWTMSFCLMTAKRKCFVNPQSRQNLTAKKMINSVTNGNFGILL